VGYVKGAFRVYELDYWALAYRKAIEEVGKIAPEGAVVEVVGPWKSAGPFARPDLVVVKKGRVAGENQPEPDFAIISSRSNGDLLTYPSAYTITAIEVEGADLAVVKEY
jgi:hypothetical protein